MKLTWKNIVLLVLMLLSAAFAAAMRPTINLADERPLIDLKTMVPTAFGEWQEQPSFSAQVIDPQQQRTIEKLYSQTLSRTYVNPEGYRIMLSIAYGKNQSDALQLHKPDLCYPAQGFTLLRRQDGKLNVQGNSIAATRLETNLGQRHEPLVYWTVVGDHITTSGTDKKITEMRYGLRGRIPDGMIVRVSSIDAVTSNAYKLQDQFAIAMIAAIAPANRNRFAGDPKLN